MTAFKRTVTVEGEAMTATAWEEVERLRAALVGANANWIEAREGRGDYPTTEAKAIAELIEVGLLPPDWEPPSH